MNSKLAGYIRTSWKNGTLKKSLLAAAIGGIAGFLYYHFVGCRSGSCAITGSPWLSTLWGGMMGFFLVNSPCASGRC